MPNAHRVLIGIQARSTSKRFPGKVFEDIGGKPLLTHVIDACKSAEHYMNRKVALTGIVVNTALLIPYDDELKRHYKGSLPIVEGPEDDVLARYAMAARQFDSTYVVRVTGDCPLIPAFIISKHVNIATRNSYDYLSNVDEKVRTAADGMDCEVISRRLLDFVDQTATDADDRQHVTTFVRRCPPHWATRAPVVGHLDLSGMKLSVDTPEDLERVRLAYNRLQEILKNAEKVYGQRSVHRV